MERRNNFKNRDGARVIGGLMLVAVGAALLMRNMGYGLPAWLFTWPMILILVGIYTGVKNNFRNNSWIILLAIGGFFLVDRFIPELKLEPAFWPLVIIGIGVLFMIRPRKKYADRGFDENDPEKKTVTDTWNPSGKTSVDKSDFLKVDSVFSGVNRTILSKNFQGGKIAAVFGGAEIDLSQADITGNVILKMDVVFGGVKLIIPSNWTVLNEIEGVFHNVDDKRRYNTSTATDPGKMLILKGSTVFGGVEVRSY